MIIGTLTIEQLIGTWLHPLQNRKLTLLYTPPSSKTMSNGYLTPPTSTTECLLGIWLHPTSNRTLYNNFDFTHLKTEFSIGICLNLPQKQNVYWEFHSTQPPKPNSQWLFWPNQPQNRAQIGHLTPPTSNAECLVGIWLHPS